MRNSREPKKTFDEKSDTRSDSVFLNRNYNNDSCTEDDVMILSDEELNSPPKVKKRKLKQIEGNVPKGDIKEDTDPKFITKRRKVHKNEVKVSEVEIGVITPNMEKETLNLGRMLNSRMSIEPFRPHLQQIVHETPMISQSKIFQNIPIPVVVPMGFYNKNNIPANEDKNVTPKSNKTVKRKTTPLVALPLRHVSKMEVSNPFQNSSGFGGFSTAGGKNLKLKKKNLKMDWLNSQPQSTEKVTMKKKKNKKKKKVVTSGFSTAGNPENHLTFKKTNENRMENIIEKNPFVVDDDLSVDVVDVVSQNSFGSTYKSNGKKSFFSHPTEDTTIVPKKGNVTDKKIQGIDEETNNQGSKRLSLFSTPGGKPLILPKRVNKAAKNLFQKGIESDKTVGNFKGFSTPGGRILEITSKGLKKAGNVFKEIGDSSSSEGRKKVGKLFNEIDKPVVSLFSRPGGKPIVIPKKRVNASKKLFEDYNNPQGNMSLFSSPTGGALKISEKGKGKSRNIFEGIDNHISIPQSSTVRRRSSFSNKRNTPISGVKKKVPQSEKKTPKRRKKKFRKTFSKKKRRKKFKVPWNGGGRRTSIPVVAKSKEKPKIDDLIIPDFLQAIMKKRPKDRVGEEKKAAVSLKELRMVEESHRSFDDLLRMGVHKDAINMDSVLAEKYRFYKIYSPGFKKLLDRTLLDVTRGIGHNEMMRMMIQMGASTKHVGVDWVRIQYRSVVWKLACYERQFPKSCTSLEIPFFSAERVLARLIYRYKEEYHFGTRACLDLLATKDRSSTCFMVLCVSRIDVRVEVQTNSKNISLTSKRIELTDGWYFINASLDECLERYVEWGRIDVGDKLSICNANLVAEASPILDMSPNSHLIVSTNSTRRAPWDSKLGFVKRFPFRVNLQSLKPDGGQLTSIQVVIERRYPIIFMEKSNGVYVTRNRRAEDEALTKFETTREISLEKIRGETMKEFEMEQSEQISLLRKKNVKRLDPEEIAKLKMNTTDPRGIMGKLTAEKQREVEREEERYQQNQQNEFQRLLESNIGDSVLRESTPMMTVLVRDSFVYKGEGDTEEYVDDIQKKCYITMWGVCDELAEEFKEGNVIQMYNLVPAKSQFQNHLQLNFYAGNSSNRFIVKDRSKTSPYAKRKVLTVSMLKSWIGGYDEEFDFVGVVLQVTPPSIFEVNERKLRSHQIYVCDETDSEAVLVVKVMERVGRTEVKFSLKLNEIFAFKNLTFDKFDPKNNFAYCYAKERTEVKCTKIENNLRNRFSMIQKKIEENSQHFETLAENTKKKVERFLRIIKGKSSDK